MEQKKIITEVYELYSKELYIYIFRFTRSHETSEDILQDSFHNLIKYSERHELDKTRIKAFLYKIAHNLCINYKKKQSHITLSPEEDADYSLSKDNSESNIETDELQEKVYELLERADPLTKSIFIMKKEQNMDIEEIAKCTGKSERTVRRRLQDVLSYMHDALKEGGFILFLFIFKMAGIACSIVY